MIKSIKVLSEVYNFDSKMPSSSYVEDKEIYIDPAFETTDNTLARAAAEAASFAGEKLKFTQKSLTASRNDEDFGFRLKNNCLPKGHILELNNEVPLYIVVGRNGIGKTTFLNSINISLRNYNIYNSTKRSALFCGNFGLSNNGLPSQSISGTIPKTNLAYVLNIDRTPFNEKDINKYTLDAFKFYLRQDEIYNNPFFDILNKFSKEEIDHRLNYLIKSEIVKFEDTTYLNKPHLERALSLAFNDLVTKFNIPDVKKRLIYLIQYRDSIPELPLSCNVYGQYEIILEDYKIDGISISQFDPRKRVLDTNSSMGEYARRELETMLYSNNKIYLLDEPTGNADRANSRWIKCEFLENMLKKQGDKTIIIASNDDSLIEKAADYGARFIDLDKEPARIVEYKELS